MRVFISLTIRKRNGRPKIMPPADLVPTNDRGVDPHILKAVDKAWSWRRKMESGADATIEDIARAEAVTPAFIRRILKLSFLAPAVLEKILNARVSPAVWHKDMATITDQPWFEQEAAVFSQQ